MLTTSGPSLATVAANMLLLQCSLNGVMWSLQVEILAIPLILGTYLLLSRWRREGLAAVWALALLLVALSFATRWNRLLAPNVQSLDLMYAFVFGVLTAAIGPGVASVLIRSSPNIARGVDRGLLRRSPAARSGLTLALHH